MSSVPSTRTQDENRTADASPPAEGVPVVVRPQPQALSKRDGHATQSTDPRRATPGDGVGIDLDEIARERLEISQRLASLQFPAAQDRRSLHPEPQTRNALYNADWRFGIALLVGLIAGGILSFTTRFTYLLSTDLGMDPSRASLEDLRECRTDLLSALPELTTQAGAENLLLQPHVRSNEEDFSLHLVARSTSREQGRQRLQQIAQLYVEQFKSNAQQQVLETQRRIDEIDAGIQTNRQRRHALQQELDGARKIITDHNAKQRYQDTSSDVAVMRADFEEVRARLAETQRELEVLERTEVPQWPEVDTATRKQAESRDLYLKQDTEALRVRLNQLRDHLRDALDAAMPRIDDTAGATSGIMDYVDTQRLKLSDRQMVAGLQEVRTKAYDLAVLLEDFRKRWKQASDHLNGLNIDPQKKDCLELQRHIHKLVQDFSYDANEHLKSLQNAYQGFVRVLENPAEHFELQSGLVQRIKQLVEQQWAWARVAKRSLPHSDFQLDAIVHSTVGLTRRVHQRRSTIDQRLSRELHDTMKEGRRDQMQALRDRRQALALEHDALLTELLGMQDQISELAGQLEQYGTLSAMLQHGHQELLELAETIERQETEKRKLLDRASRLARARNALSLDPAQASAWPINTMDRLSKIGFGGLSAVIGSYLLLTLGAHLVRRGS